MLKKIGISILVLGLIGAGAYVAIEKNLFSRAGSKIQELTISKGKVGVLYDIQTVKTGYYDFDAAKYKGQKKYIYQLNGETIKETQKVDEQKRAYEARETTIWVVNKTAKYKTKDRTITMYYGHDRLDKSHVGWITASQFDKVDVQSAKSTKGADASSTKVFEPKETLNVQENDIANLVGDGVTDDSVGLKKLFDYTKDHPYTELYFPEGEYSISPLGDAVSEWDDRVMIELHSHTFVNMEKEARIVVKNKQTFCFFTRPTAKGMDGGVTDFHWKGGVLARTDDLDNGSKPMIYTLFSLVHVTNSSFEDTVFDGIQNVSGHNYDLCGNENITISGNSYIGYGNTLDVQPDIGNNSGQHPLYSEIIELDFAYAPGPYGDFSAFGMEVWDLFTKEEQSFIDNLPNRKITISNNIVEPKISNTGEMVSYGQNFVGSHVSRADLPRDKFTSDLLIENNKIINPIPVENVSFTATGEKKKANFPWNGILHFTELDRAVIRNNTFEINAADIQKRASIISMFDGGTSVKNIDGVIIEGNKIASAKGHYEKFIEWGGSGKQVEELKSKIQSAN